MNIKGRLKKRIKKTKNLTKRLKPGGDIALIAHKDLDEIAALSLVEKKVKCVINVEKTISGRYPNQGPSILLDANIPIFETCNKDIFDIVREGDIIEIVDETIFIREKKLEIVFY